MFKMDETTYGSQGSIVKNLETVVIALQRVEKGSTSTSSIMQGKSLNHKVSRGIL